LLTVGLRLPLREQLTVLWILVLASLVEVGLRTVSFNQVARWFRVSLITDSTDNPNTPGTPDFDETERRQIRNVLRVMHYWPFAKGSCLRQSILLAYLLRRREPVVRLGVSRQDDEIVAHAWVDICGISLGHIDGYAAMEKGPVSGSPSSLDETD
jgi:hypothetical protein